MVKTNEDQKVAARLRQARENAGYATREAFAEFAGIKPVTYRAHEGGRGVQAWIDFYAEKLGIDKNWLRYGSVMETGGVNKTLVESNSLTFDKGNSRREDVPIKRAGLAGATAKDHGKQDLRLAIFGSMPGAAGGWIMNASPAGHIERPERLKDAEDAFALYMIGNDMWPRVKDGQTLYIHPTQHPKIEDCVVIFLKREPKEWICRDLVDRQGDHITVRQYGRNAEPAEYDIPWTDIARYYAVV